MTATELEPAAGRAAVSPDVTASLPPGTILINFELACLHGGSATLEQWRGQRLLLVFFDPRSDQCLTLLPWLAAVPLDPPSDRPLLVLISRGHPDDTADLLQAHGIGLPVLLEEADELARLYRVPGVPAGFLIDERGRTVGEMLTGSEAVRLAWEGQSVTPGHGLIDVPHQTEPPRDLHHGLSPGTYAPEIQLPLIDGSVLDLAGYRGRRTLLVFSDPILGEWDRIGPTLREVHSDPRGIPVLLISNGKESRIRAAASAHAFTFPIACQTRREVARRYATLATPVAYLLDEHGIIAAEPAFGVDAILHLASRVLPGGDGPASLSRPEQTFASANGRQE